MDSGSGTSFVQAAVNSAGTQLTISTDHAAAAGNANDMIYGTGVTSSLSLAQTPTAAGTASATTLGTVSLVAGDAASTALAGTLTLGTETITLGTAATSTLPGTATLSELAQTINAGNYGVSATLNTAGTAMSLGPSARGEGEACSGPCSRAAGALVVIGMRRSLTAGRWHCPSHAVMPWSRDSDNKLVTIMIRSVYAESAGSS